MEDNVVLVKNVYKDFRLPHEKAHSVKAVFTSIFKKKNRKITNRHALSDISFEIKKGEFFGIVGRNGSGKSTMLKILAGIYQPTKGSVATKGKLVPFIELGVGFNPELTGYENVYLNGAMLGFSKKEIDGMYRAIVGFAELEDFMDQKLKNYSSGMQVRLAFSMAIRAEADILLVDEVLAVGDADFQRKCFEYFKSLKKNKKTVVFVSHNMEAIKEYCDRAVLINDNRVIDIGNPEDIAKQYTRMFMVEKKLETKLSNERWGSFGIKYDKIKIKPDKLTNESPLIIEVSALAKEYVEDVVFGFSIRDASGRILLGTNSLLKELRIRTMKPDERKTIRWSIPNIFNDGEYSVNLAIVRGSSVDTYDWWDDAARFLVVREERTPYPVNPFVKVELV